MSEQKTPPQSVGVKPESSNLWMRVLAAAVMAPLAILLAWAGGWFWAALATLAAIGMYIEWLSIVGTQQSRLAASGVAALLIAGICLALEHHGGALVVYGIGLVAVVLLTRGDRRWPVSGLLYAVVAQIAAVLVRQDPVWGWSALLFVMLVVWATDIGGYFAGRTIGGPKLWVRVSPKKTWAGAIGGLTGSLIVAAGFAASGIGRMVSMLLLAAALSVVSQLGDLFESAVKRRFGVKDSSHLIPGHGGVLDRIDGFVAAIVLAAIIGVMRGGADGVARGLMVW